MLDGFDAMLNASESRWTALQFAAFPPSLARPAAAGQRESTQGPTVS